MKIVSGVEPWIIPQEGHVVETITQQKRGIQPMLF